MHYWKYWDLRDNHLWTLVPIFVAPHLLQHLLTVGHLVLAFVRFWFCSCFWLCSCPTQEKCRKEYWGVHQEGVSVTLIKLCFVWKWQQVTWYLSIIFPIQIPSPALQQQGTDAKYVSIYSFYSINPIQLTLFFRQFSTNFISAWEKIRCFILSVRIPGCEKETNDFLDVCVVWHLLANKNTNLDRLFLKKSHKISKCYVNVVIL